MKIFSTLMLSALALPAYGFQADPAPGTQIDISDQDAVTVMKSLIDAGVPSDNSKADKLEVNVQGLSCNVNLAKPGVSVCKATQDAKEFNIKDEQAAGLMAVFTTHNAVHINDDASLTASAKTISCSSPVPDNGTALCHLTFTTSAN